MVSPPPAWRLYNACCIVATLVARRSRSLQTAVLKLALRPIDDELHHQVTAPHTIHAWPTHAHQAKAVAVAATGRDRHRCRRDDRPAGGTRACGSCPFGPRPP